MASEDDKDWHIIPLYRSDLSTKCFYGRFAPHRDIDLTNCEVEIEEEDESDPQTSGTNGKCPDNAKKPHRFVMNVKDGDEQKRFRATRNLGNQSHYVVFEIEESRATVYPVDGWYDFKPIVDCDVLTYEEVEEVFKMKNKVLNNFAVNSAMKRKREEIGATMDCEPKSKKAKKPDLANDPANDSDDSIDNYVKEKKDKKKKKKKKRTKERKVKYDDDGKEVEEVEEEEFDERDGQHIDYLSDFDYDDDDEDDNDDDGDMEMIWDVGEDDKYEDGQDDGGDEDDEYDEEEQ